MTHQIDLLYQTASIFEKLNTPKNPLEYLKNLEPEEKSFIELLHSTYPYTTVFEKGTSDKIMSVLFWIRYCVDLGLISYKENLYLIDAIKKSEGPL